MPKSIKTKHIDRMFPFEFFDELNEQIKDGYVLGNQAFVVNHKLKIPKEERRKLFKESGVKEIANKINEQNIVSVEPFGEVLFLDVCYRVEDIDKIINNKDRSQVPMSILMVQLYDSSDQPIFSEEVAEETISKIPEILWDDPSLMIGVITLSDDNPDGPVVACLQIPAPIENKILVNIDEGHTPTKK